ncbi:thiamine pyrophosphokinase [Mucilaginibacter mali]|uniref:Thiamine pyrophosphokinase n=1 Tax=Mucilaginibacter mali TaxID=2740462 RepID=A0A7D4UL30_9SPHI|nr:thiamine pyrophosphokinase [Mucilaginibacter mali]QKJ31402.1 thiamine pyrophosphokinase [Mucilaginibacter mali]
MSSHHIVREKQEPALLIAGLDNFPDELLGQLLEWSPTVVVTADVAEKVQSQGIKIDWLVADEMPDLQQSDIKQFPLAGNHPLVAALDQLIAQGYPAINLVSDELDIEVLAPYFSQTDLVVFYDDKKIVALHNGFSKWQPAGNRIEILTQSHNLVYTNLVQVADDLYEVVQDGFYRLQFSDAYLLVAEAL